jgi:hypothetical protein
LGKGNSSRFNKRNWLRQDFLENKYLVTTNLQLTSNWKKYIIPIPDASKLRAERGLFGMLKEQKMVKVILLIDELKFEKLGTI